AADNRWAHGAGESESHPVTSAKNSTKFLSHLHSPFTILLPSPRRPRFAATVWADHIITSTMFGRAHSPIGGQVTMSDSKEISGVARRRFLQGSGAAAAATALGAVPTQLEAGERQGGGNGQQVPGMGPNGVKLTLNVNGRNVNTTVEPRVTLLDALRNYLDV